MPRANPSQLSHLIVVVLAMHVLWSELECSVLSISVLAYLILTWMELIWSDMHPKVSHILSYLQSTFSRRSVCWLGVSLIDALS